MGYNELKYRKRLSTTVDINIMRAFEQLARQKKQPKSWLMDEAIEDLLRKNGIEVKKAKEE